MARKSDARMVITLACTGMPRAQLYDREEPKKRSRSDRTEQILPALP